jgi:hypothetical protein
MEAEVISAKFDLQHIYSQKINYFLMDTLAGAMDTVISLLAKNTGSIPNAALKLVRAYLDGGYTTRAFSYADSLSEIETYSVAMVLETALLKLDTSRSNLHTLDPNSELADILTEFAADSTKPGCWQARAALNYAFGHSMNFSFLFPVDESEKRSESLATSSNQNDITLSLANETRQVRIFPNPTENAVWISFSDHDKKDCRYVFYDILGKEKCSGMVISNTAKEIDTSGLVNGIYFITLLQDEEILAQQKLIINR